MQHQGVEDSTSDLKEQLENFIRFQFNFTILSLSQQGVNRLSLALIEGVITSKVAQQPRISVLELEVVVAKDNFAFIVYDCLLAINKGLLLGQVYQEAISVGDGPRLKGALGVGCDQLPVVSADEDDQMRNAIDVLMDVSRIVMVHPID
jgi:hypothetical protein